MEDLEKLRAESWELLEVEYDRLPQVVKDVVFLARPDLVRALPDVFITSMCAQLCALWGELHYRKGERAGEMP